MSDCELTARTYTHTSEIARASQGVNARSSTQSTSSSKKSKRRNRPCRTRNPPRSTPSATNPSFGQQHAHDAVGSRGPSIRGMSGRALNGHSGAGGRLHVASMASTLSHGTTDYSKASTRDWVASQQPSPSTSSRAVSVVTDNISEVNQSPPPSSSPLSVPQPAPLFHIQDSRVIFSARNDNGTVIKADRFSTPRLSELVLPTSENKMEDITAHLCVEWQARHQELQARNDRNPALYRLIGHSRPSELPSSYYNARVCLPATFCSTPDYDFALPASEDGMRSLIQYLWEEWTIRYMRDHVQSRYGGIDANGVLKASPALTWTGWDENAPSTPMDLLIQQLHQTTLSSDSNSHSTSSSLSGLRAGELSGFQRVASDSSASSVRSLSPRKRTLDLDGLFAVDEPDGSSSRAKKARSE